MSYGGGGRRFIHARLLIPQKSSRSRNEGRAKGGAPSRGIGAKRIGGDDSFTGGIHPHDGVTEVGKIRALIQVVGGGDSHNVALQPGGIYHLFFPIVPRGRSTNDTLLFGIVQSLV